MSETTLQTWNINGIEFEAVATINEGSLLEVGIVQNPTFTSDSDRLYFFGPSQLEDSDLEQLVDEGFLEVFSPAWLIVPGCFSLRVKLDAEGKFDDGSEPADCIICKRAFSFRDDGDNVIQTAPASGPSWSSGGSPAEYDSACTECIEADPQEEEPEYDGCYDDERGL